VESPEDWRAAGMKYLLGKPLSRKDLGRVLQLIDSRRGNLANVRSLKKVQTYRES
jgi:hypothetical protein